MKKVSAVKSRKRRYLEILKKSPKLYYSALFSSSREDNDFAVTARCVLSPGAAAFALWLLFHAVQKGQKQLYFLPGNGQIFFYEAARFLAKRLALPVECCFLNSPVPSFWDDVSFAFVEGDPFGVTQQRFTRMFPYFYPSFEKWLSKKPCFSPFVFGVPFLKKELFAFLGIFADEIASFDISEKELEQDLQTVRKLFREMTQAFPKELSRQNPFKFC